MDTGFFTILEDGWDAGLYVCFGLDIDLKRIPLVLDKCGNVDVFQTVMDFNRPVIEKCVHLLMFLR